MHALCSSRCRTCLHFVTFDLVSNTQVVEPYDPFLDGHVTTYEIGKNNSCSTKLKEYCNGPLRAGRSYRVKIRAFTDDDKYSDTEYTIMSTDDDKTWVILSLCIPLILIFSLVVCLLYLRRRRTAFGRRAKKGVNHVDTTSLPESIIETS